MPAPELLRDEIAELEVHDVRETIFFSREGGRLRQWLEVDLVWRGWRADLRFEVRAGSMRERWRAAALGGGTITVRVPAPAVWPKPPVADARLIIREGDRVIEAVVTVGTHRPWTVYLISDLCADDTWAYSDPAAHDRDDYLTTLAELCADPENRYNFATAHQVTRFRRQASPAENRELTDALRSGRFYVTPVPNQLDCAAFNLGTYPLLLEPYRAHRDRAHIPDSVGRDAYHMEAPTWTGGLVNLLACAGFRSFGKSLLAAGAAPWVDGPLRKIRRLTRVEAAPGRFVYMLLGCDAYSEGMPLLAGLPHATRFLHESVIPAHEAQGAAYPTSAIALIGAYSDLFPGAREWTRPKLDAVRRYNAQGWDYPRLVNATWTDYFDHVVGEVGPPERPKAMGLRTVRGDTGASWEAWLLRVQQEAAAFRQAQRDVVSARTLAAMLGTRGVGRALAAAAHELVNLGDHAWNGSHPESKDLNLRIRRDRLKRLNAALREARSRTAGDVVFAPGKRVGVVNTLGWRRACVVEAPEADGLALIDPDGGGAFPVVDGRAAVPDVPAFGARVLKVVHAEGPLGRSDCSAVIDDMCPELYVDGKRAEVDGGWADDQCGRWQAGPFSVRAEVARAAAVDGTELRVRVKGKPPAGSYSLVWRFGLPWKRCRWRAETGGRFMTPGPSADSLLGIVGAGIDVGEALSASSTGGRERVDFAFRESGFCGIGGPTMELTRGDPHGYLRGSYTREGLLKGKTTEGVLCWYLLTTDPLANEQLPDQGGARAWEFRCTVRRGKGAIGDADLYRYAASCARPAEVVAPGKARRLAEPWLKVTGSRDVIVLGASRRGRATEIDLYNCAPGRRTVSLSGRATDRGRIAAADMLGREQGPCPDGRLSIPAGAFIKVLVR